MSLVIDLHQGKDDLSRLVNQALAGEDVIFARDGKVVARLVPVPGSRVPGLARGKVILRPDFNEPLPGDLLDAFEASKGK